MNLLRQALYVTVVKDTKLVALVYGAPLVGIRFSFHRLQWPIAAVCGLPSSTNSDSDS
jgi:hypothetical protein